MTQPEFDDWFDYHAAAFPGLRAWLGRCKHAHLTMGHWLRVLAPVSLSDATAATNAMTESGERTPPYERHPATVKQMAQRYAADRRSREAYAPSPSTAAGDICLSRQEVLQVMAECKRRVAEAASRKPILSLRGGAVQVQHDPHESARTKSYPANKDDEKRLLAKWPHLIPPPPPEPEKRNAAKRPGR